MDKESLKKVEQWKSMGIRMVELEWPDNGGILFAFYTHGINADSIDKRRFLTPSVRDWASGLDEDDMQVLDVTDDPNEMSGFDTDFDRYVVQQLV